MQQDCYKNPYKNKRQLSYYAHDKLIQYKKSLLSLQLLKNVLLPEHYKLTEFHLIEICKATHACCTLSVQNRDCLLCLYKATFTCAKITRIDTFEVSIYCFPRLTDSKMSVDGCITGSSC